MTSVWWAYLHWTVGRAAIVFAWVNMFLGCVLAWLLWCKQLP